MRHLSFAVLAGLVAVSPAFAQVDERVIVASVVDQRGNPVAGLTTKDFVVREDGMSREVLRVVKDEDPLQIALLVDNSAEMRNDLAMLRNAVSAFVSTLRPGVELSIITIAERPTIVVPYTSDKEVLQRGVGRIVTYNSGNYLLDGIAEASEGLAKRPNARSAIAVVMRRGHELSHREYTDVLRIVEASGTPALHVMVLGGMNVSLDLPDGLPDAVTFDSRQNADRDLVLARLTRATGGRYEDVLAISAVTMKLSQLAGELSNQYRVTFARPQRLIPPEKTEISARDPKLRARGRLVDE
jgi:VWFA-related protein